MDTATPGIIAARPDALPIAGTGLRSLAARLEACGMQDAINLDAAVVELSSRVVRWRAAGFEVGDPTWRDQGEGWPSPFKTVRAEVLEPDSVGIAVRRGPKEGEVVLFAGGWCDVGFWSGLAADEPIAEAPGYDSPLTVGGYADVLDAFIRRFD